VTPSNIIQGETAQLIADSTGNATFSWTPLNQISDPTIFNPMITPDSTREYCVAVTGYNGCVDTACVTIEVFIPEPTIHCPTAFSPNGDGLNDVWMPIINRCYTVQAFIVCNRWGETVYDYKRYAWFYWDGTYKGVPMPIGTYVYYIVARCSERPNAEVFKGTITLLR
jgi:gliding motility-associated-like protein